MKNAFTIVALASVAALPAFATPQFTTPTGPSPTSTSCSNPGTYRCSGNTIQVCNSSRQWVLSAICSGRCGNMNNLPYCV
ncbi:hypothetical protein QBC43DRAFT_284772 [Cladorrhinum sp. PSN259]|nr:hypothetical protein QBC43DRAFT_284772 [Cladorrhinum sp. PSN259]